MKSYFALLIHLCTAHAHQLPGDFLYQESPLPKHHLEEFFSDATVCQPALPCTLDLALCNNQTASHEQNNSEDFYPNIDREWSYIGSIGDQLHLVWAYYYEAGCWGKFTALLLVKREGSKLTITDILYGGDRHASMIHENGITIQGNTISYLQSITSMEFIDLYRMEFKNRIFGGAKAPQFVDLKWPHIFNIRLLKIGKFRKLSRCPKPIYEFHSV